MSNLALTLGFELTSIPVNQAEGEPAPVEEESFDPDAFDVDAFDTDAFALVA